MLTALYLLVALPVVAGLLYLLATVRVWRSNQMLAVLMFLFSTVHVSLGFYRLIRGFIDLRDLPGGPGAYFSDVSTPPNVAKVTIHSVNSILGDSIVVRCLPCRF